MSPVPLDRLPYTHHFTVLKQEFIRLSGSQIPDHEIWLYLIGARKRGLLA